MTTNSTKPHITPPPSQGAPRDRWMGQLVFGATLIATAGIGIGACQQLAAQDERTTQLNRQLLTLQQELVAARTTEPLPLDPAATLPAQPSRRQPDTAPRLDRTPAAAGEAVPHSEDGTPQAKHELPACRQRGAITRPGNGSLVGSVFEVRVTHREEGRHLWLFVQHSGKAWPKEPKVTPTRTGEWVGDISEGGYPPGLRFDLVLLDVPQAFNDDIEAWFKRGHRIRSYPGFDLGLIRTKGACVVDAKHLHLAGPPN